jgi:hypothetical protein
MVSSLFARRTIGGWQKFKLEVIKVRWTRSQILLSVFDKKYRHLFERLGCSVEKDERIIRHVGGLEREVVVSVKWKGTWLSHSIRINEVDSRDGKWVIVGGIRDTVSRELDEKIWKAFYHSCNLVLCKVVEDIAHSFGVFPAVYFSLQSGLTVKVGEGQEVKIPVDGVDEKAVSNIFALASL